MEYFSDLKAKLIYVFRIPDNAHRDCVKIGEATFEDGNLTLPPNSSALNKAAKERIDQYTKTAGIAYDLLHAEIALFSRDGKIGSINDKEVHDVLLRSGIRRKKFPHVSGANEWFVCDLETAKQAIAAAKAGKKALHTSQITEGQSPIIFRPEQREAIDKTLKRFKKGNQMLWNAKMRFGKTLSALQTVKEWNQTAADDARYKPFRRVLILTHRPVVDAGWFEDFGKIFYDTPEFVYGSKTNGDSYQSLEAQCRKGECRYIYFASMQDLRGSELVGGNFDKNNEVFSNPWDLIIVDEAHEGTQTELGQNVLKELQKDETKVLKLSGTPFNLLDDYTEEEIYTWDYVMEQRAKAQWDIDHPGDYNPYAGLPRLNIYTYDLGRLMNEYADEDIAFNFREFFRTNDDGEFIHRQHVENFLHLLTKTDEESMFPFANRRYRDIFRHTLWMLPGVKAAKALSTMLRNHPVFGMFEIVNVAGDGDEEESRENALRKVENAIGEDPDQTHTITLSCGRLTTGVSVKPWTGVLMLSGTYNTAASAYMQTIFRVQTPATINGRVKEDCYVFDFAPDRTLKVLAETAKISTKAGKQGESERQQLGEFLNFCPIISVEGGQMQQFDTEHMLQQLKRVYVERVVQNGFEDGYLYNDELMKLTDVDIQEFNDLRGIIGQTKAMGKTNNIDINKQGLTDEEYAEKEKLEKKKKKELTEEEKARLEELKKKRKLKDDAISILRGISIRMPLLIYGATIEDEDRQLTIDNFTQLVDPQSWEEFMPKGVSKQKFNAFKKYYDPDIFAAAGKRIRQMARAADNLTIEERIERISAIFATFRNPDKETVLTPWRVVNMHMSDTLGGYCFYNEGFTEPITEPRFVERGNVTANVFAPGSHLLEINSKSGLYPLYLAYNLYRTMLRSLTYSPETLEEHQEVWDKVIAESIFVICKTPMAKSITRRTLLGFRKSKTNMWAPDDLINKIKNQPELFIKKVHDLIGKNMRINAIVGNPPYQVMDGGAQASSLPVYNLFVEIATKLAPTYISMIMPARWYAGGRGLDDFRTFMLKEPSIRYFYDFPIASNLFNNVEIKGGLCYFLMDCHFNNQITPTTVVTCSDKGNFISQRNLSTKNSDIFIRDGRGLSIINKITSKETKYFNEIVSALRPFGLRGYYINDPNFHSHSEGLTNPVICIGKGLLKGYVELVNIPQRQEWINRYKVIIPRANNIATEANDDNLNAFVGEPNVICTESYLCIGADKDYSPIECENICSYLRSRFARFMHSQAKSSQDATAKTFRYVPMQDFTENGDIDWSKSIAEIDTQLYAKYHLDDEEIKFIESMIKPMQ